MDEFRELGRITQGVTVIRLAEGEHVVGVDRIPYIEGLEDDGLEDEGESEEGTDGDGGAEAPL